MFHISFLVRDKHLAETLRALENRVMNLEVQPTKHSEKDNSTDSKLVRVARTEVEAVVESLITNGVPFTTHNLMEAAHCSHSAAVKAINRFKEADRIVKVEKSGHRPFYLKKEELANVS